MRTTCYLLAICCAVAFSGAVFAQDNPFSGSGSADPFGGPIKPVEKKPAGKKVPSAAGKKASDSPRAWTEAEWRIRSALSDESTAEFFDQPLDEAIQQLSQTHDIPIVIDRRGLEEVGLSDDTPVTLSIHKVTLRSLLRLMLRDLELTYVVKDEVLQITTNEAAERNLALGTYIFPEVLADKSEQILAALTTTVDPDQWSASGGPCNVSVVDHVLVVSATERVHDNVLEFLERLQAAFEKHTAGK